MEVMDKRLVGKLGMQMTIVSGKLGVVTVLLTFDRIGPSVDNGD